MSSGVGDAARPEAVEPYVRGAAWPATIGASYPRADLADPRLPADTRATATVPVGVRLEFVGDATALDISYRTTSDDLGYRGPSAGTTFSVWRGDELLDEQTASLGSGSVRLHVGGGGAERVIVYLPERMRPLIKAVAGVSGTIEPAARQPRWIAYGDSIVEGWVSAGPAYAWPAIVGRQHGLDVANMGYAGSARGELATAEHIAALAADVISLSWGTNCWSQVPHSTEMMQATTEAFLGTVRAGHPGIPIVISSPILRPHAEDTANELGATLVDLRKAMENSVCALSDDLITLVPGRDLLSLTHLADGVHPGNDGHQILAQVLGGVIASALRNCRTD